MKFIIPSFGVSDLTVSDFDFRLYLGTDVQDTPEALTITYSGSGDLVVDGLPDSPILPESLGPNPYTLTWYIFGQCGSKVWGGSGTPSAFIIPSREASLTAPDFNLAVFTDGVLNPVSLLVTELGSPGDYAVTGWVAQTTGLEWVLIWRRSEISNLYSWRESLFAVHSAVTYTEILANHVPFPFNTDSQERVMFSVNFRARTANVSIVSLSLPDDLAKILSDFSVGIPGNNLFVGPLARIPDGDGPYITILGTSGVESIETHNGDRFHRPGAQIVIRGKPYSVVESMANSIHSTLHGLRDITVVYGSG